VHGLDHLGHGRSEGEQVMVPDFSPVVEDVHSVVLQARAANPGLPVAMIGQSMGGMIAARYAQCTRRGGRAGPERAGIGTWTPVTQLLGYEVIPSDPLDITTLSRDEEVGRVNSQDPTSGTARSGGPRCSG
jgi:acetyl esterase/lipase